MSYRETLYQSYFGTQAGKVGSDDLRARMRQEHPQLRAEVLPFLPADKQAPILELGCGWGCFLSFARDQGYTQVEGIDVSGEQIAQAHALGLDHARQGDALALLASAEGRYAAIVALDVIEHFSRDELVKLLGLMKSALRPGGAVILRTPNADAVFASINVHGDFTHELALNPQSGRQLLSATGFADVVVAPSHVAFVSPWREALRRVIYPPVRVGAALALFAFGRGMKAIVTPNIVLRGVRA